MDAMTVQRFLDGMKFEAERTGPPEGFPKMPDIPAGRYVDPAFLALEREHLWRKSWLYACHSTRFHKTRQLHPVTQDGLADHHRARQGRQRPRLLQHLPASRRAAGEDRIWRAQWLRVRLSRLDILARRQAHQSARQARLHRARHVCPLAHRRALRALLQLGIHQRGSGGRAADRSTSRLSSSTSSNSSRTSGASS